jgi:hypothetical protein
MLLNKNEIINMFNSLRPNCCGNRQLYKAGFQKSASQVKYEDLKEQLKLKQRSRVE